MGLAGLDSLSEIMELPPKSVVPIEKMIGDDDEDNILLQQMSKDAEEYIRSFSWCGGILRAFFGGCVGGIFAVFLYQIIPARPDVSSWIWIVEGDVPSAYLPIEDAESPAAVFDAYLGGMKKWIALAREGRTATPKTAFRHSTSRTHPNGQRSWNRDSER
jgi:hypothetical protein